MDKVEDQVKYKPQDLQKIVQQLQAQLAENDLVLKQKDTQITQLRQDYQHLLEQFRLAQQQRYGKSSEASSNQLGLFNEAEEIAQEVASEDSTNSQEETITYKRNKPIRTVLPKHLPKETIVHDIADADKVCDCCGTDLQHMGNETREQLEFIPAQVKVVEHIRLKYSCRHCEKHNTNTPIKIAPVPNTPIPKSIATPSLLSQIITSKYQYALPLYRQEHLFKQYGIALNRKTMSSWMMRCAQILTPVYEHLKQKQLQQSVIFADESPLQVINEDKSNGYMWVYCTGVDSPSKDPPKTKQIGDQTNRQINSHSRRNIVIYEFQNSRAGACPKKYLQGFEGYLQVDGYAGYEQVDATLVGCFAHARRKFTDVKKTQVKGKSGKADIALSFIQKLYRIESEIKDNRIEEKYAIRQARAKPLLKEYKDWLDKSALNVPPKSALGKAINYNLNQWYKLVRYIEDGSLNIDNNRAERAIKPFVIGRKNWLFSNTSNGAHASAILYSLVETAKANGLIPFDYLNDLFEELAKQHSNVEHLMPWNFQKEK